MSKGGDLKNYIIILLSGNISKIRNWNTAFSDIYRESWRDRDTEKNEGIRGRENDTEGRKRER